MQDASISVSCSFLLLHVMHVVLVILAMFYKRSASTSFSLKSILINIVQNACSCASIKDNWAKCFFCLVILSLTFYMIADLFLEKIPQVK